MRSLTASILFPINDFIFSTECFHCGEPLSDSESRLCSNCWQTLTPVRPEDFTYQVMIKRFREEGVIDGFIPLYYFEKGKVLQNIAHSLKYEEITSFGRELGEKVGRCLIEKNVFADVVISIPLNKRKERERGYNQSEFIAKGVSSVAGMPVLSNAVRRTKYTATQTHLNAEERKENVSDAFTIDSKYCDLIKDKSVIIVDDIVTTGSTIQEVGRVLKENGARNIIAASAGLAKLGEDG